MEKEFSAALHPTQYGNHIKDGRHRATLINPEVRKLMDAGMSKRTAYRHAAETNPKKKESDFNYDKETHERRMGMKCDELKAEQLLDYSGEPMPCYPKATVDAAIAELKQKLEDAKATAYAESVDAGMRERRLKRALYKALANWAHFAVAFFSSFKTKDKWHKMEHKCLKKAEDYK